MNELSGPYTQTILSSRPTAYFRMAESSWTPVLDITGNGHNGGFESGVVFYLEGPRSPQFCGENQINRCPHFAGGRMRVALKDIRNQYSIELWFYNCLSPDARPVTGYLFSRGPDGAEDAPGDHVGIGGTATSKGKLIFEVAVPPKPT